MSLLGELKNLTQTFNPVALIGDQVAGLAESVCDKLGLEPIGDLASGAIHFYTGNYAGMAEDAIDLSENVAAGLQGFAEGFFKTEPEPPAAAQPNLLGDFRSINHETINRLKDAVQGMRAEGGGGGSPRAETDGAPEASHSKVASDGAPETSNAKATTGATSASSNDKATGGSQDAKDFLALALKNPDEFYQRVLAGDIPDSIKDMPGGMEALQANVQAIARMMQLVTQMMTALHETQMAVIRNVRA